MRKLHRPKSTRKLTSLSASSRIYLAASLLLLLGGVIAGISIVSEPLPLPQTQRPVVANASNALIEFPIRNTAGLMLNRDRNVNYVAADVSIPGWLGTGGSTNDSWLGLIFQNINLPPNAQPASVKLVLTADRNHYMKLDLRFKRCPVDQALQNINFSQYAANASTDLALMDDSTWEKDRSYGLDISNLFKTGGVIKFDSDKLCLLVKGDSAKAWQRKYFYSNVVSGKAPKLVVEYQVIQDSMFGTQLYVAPNGQVPQISSDRVYSSIQAAVNSISTNDLQSGVQINVQPGVYRESVTMANLRPSTDKPVKLVAARGKGTVTILGSESSQDRRITWQKGTNGQQFPAAANGKIFYANVSAWGGNPEIAINPSNNQRLRKAMEPDIDPFHMDYATDARWKADGRASSGSQNTLVSGNLKNINGFSSSFLKGARIFTTDGYTAHDHYSTMITDHNAGSGTITLDRNLTYYSGSPLIDAGARFYVEGKSQLLDQPGEWYYDSATKMLYIWPLNDISPANQPVEFAVRAKGLSITNSQNIEVKDINISNVNYLYGRSIDDDGALYIVNRSSNQASQNITINGVTITNSGIGIRVYQNSGSRLLTQNVKILNTKVDMIDGLAMAVFKYPIVDSANAFVPAIKGLTVQNSSFSQGGFRPNGNGIMMWIQHVQNFIFSNNLVTKSAHNGIEIQGGYDTNVLVYNNAFVDNCLAASDCGGFKVWGDKYPMRNVLVYNNISRGTKGCSLVSMEKGAWTTSNGPGCGASGFYSDIVRSNVSGETAVVYYHNVSEGNGNGGFQLTRSQDHFVGANYMINNPFGIRSTNSTSNPQKLGNSQILGNVFTRSNNANNPNLTNRDYGIYVALETEADRQAVNINNNKYMMSGQSALDLYLRQTSTFSTQKGYKTISEVRAATPWEDQGQDLGGSFLGIPTRSNGFDISNLDSAYGTSPTSMPTQVRSMITRLQQALGVSVQIDSWVGIRP